MRIHRFGDVWNFWTVKYLRQIRHNKSLLISAIGLAIVQFLIFRVFLENWSYRPSWPWCLPWMLFFCGLASVLCVAQGFANPTGKDGMRPGLSHFIGFAPLDEWALFRGFLLSVLLTFGMITGICLPLWVASGFFFFSRIPVLLVWMGETFFLMLFVLQPGTRRWFRADLMTAVVMLCGWTKVWFYEQPRVTTLVLFGILGLWQLLNFRETLRLPVEVSEVWLRAGQLTLLLAGWGMFYAPFQLTVPILVMMGALGSLASMAGALHGVPRMQLAELPDSRLLRLPAFLLYGASTGGWLWCWAMTGFGWWILPRFKGPDFWMFLLTWGLFWAEVMFLLLRSSRRRPGRKRAPVAYHLAILGGLCVTGVALALLAISFQFDGGRVFRNAALAGWGAAALLFLPQIPRMLHDFVRFFWRIDR